MFHKQTFTGVWIESAELVTARVVKPIVEEEKTRHYRGFVSMCLRILPFIFPDALMPAKCFLCQWRDLPSVGIRQQGKLLSLPLYSSSIPCAFCKSEQLTSKQQASNKHPVAGCS